MQGYGAYGNAALGYPELGMVILTESGLYACEVKPDDEAKSGEEKEATGLSVEDIAR